MSQIEYFILDIERRRREGGQDILESNSYLHFCSKSASQKTLTPYPASHFI